MLFININSWKEWNKMEEKEQQVLDKYQTWQPYLKYKNTLYEDQIRVQVSIYNNYIGCSGCSSCSGPE